MRPLTTPTPPPAPRTPPSRPRDCRVSGSRFAHAVIVVVGDGGADHGGVEVVDDVGHARARAHDGERSDASIRSPRRAAFKHVSRQRVLPNRRRQEGRGKPCHTRRIRYDRLSTGLLKLFLKRNTMPDREWLVEYTDEFGAW